MSIIVPFDYDGDLTTTILDIEVTLRKNTGYNNCWTIAISDNDNELYSTGCSDTYGDKLDGYNSCSECHYYDDHYYQRSKKLLFLANDIIIDNHTIKFRKFTDLYSNVAKDIGDSISSFTYQVQICYS